MFSHENLWFAIDVTYALSQAPTSESSVIVKCKKKKKNIQEGIVILVCGVFCSDTGNVW